MGTIAKSTPTNVRPFAPTTSDPFHAFIYSLYISMVNKERLPPTCVSCVLSCGASAARQHDAASHRRLLWPTSERRRR